MCWYRPRPPSSRGGTAIGPAAFPRRMASSSAEEGYHLSIALLLRQAYRGVACVILQCGVGAVGYQQLDDFVSAKKRGHHESGLSHIVGRVDVTMFGEQRIRDLAVAVERDNHQGGVAIRIGGAGIGSLGDQEIDRLGLLVIRSKNQRREPMRIALIGIHPGLDQTVEEIDAARAGSIEIEFFDVLGSKGLALRQGILKPDKPEADGKREPGSTPLCLRRPHIISFARRGGRGPRPAADLAKADGFSCLTASSRST